VHGFAEDVFAEDGAEGGFAVAAAGEGSAAGAFELDITALAVKIDDFAEEEGAAVTELGHEVAELVAGVGLGEGLGAVGKGVAGEEGGVIGVVEGFGVETEGAGEGVIEEDEAGGADGDEFPALMEEGGELGVRMVEVPAVG
jgi:hypothetical protein